VNDKHQEPSGDLSRSAARILLLGIMALALALRVYRLGTESVWWDEYTSLMHLDAPGLWDFLKLNRMFDPATLPLYYALEYLCWHFVSGSVLALRWLSVLLGLACVPALYALGRALGGRKAGLIAALCLALSPIHIFHAQGIRMYVLLCLLALLSLWTFVQILQDGRGRWWAAHAVVNFLLMWTHPFAALVLAVEGLYLAARCWRNWVKVVAWALLNVLLLAPTAAYLLNVRFWPEDTTGNWLKIPAVAEFLADVFADDAVALTYQLRISERIWPGLVSLHPFFDAALCLLPLLCVGLWLWTRTRKPAPRARFGLLLLWLLLPPVTLYAASLVWRPCIFPRYTAHCAFALYLMAGCAVASLPRKPLQLAGTAVLALLLGYQAALTLPGPQRTDWKGAAGYVRTHAGPDDAVLVYIAIWRDVFVYNLGPAPNPISSADDRAVLADQARFLLDHAAENDRGVWVLLPTPYFDSGPDLEFEQAAGAQGLSWTMQEFGGIEHVLVYRMARAPGADGALSPPNTGAYAYVEAYGNLAIALAEHGEPALALDALRKTANADGSVDPVYGNLVAALERGSGIEQPLAAVKSIRLGYRVHSQFAVDRFRQAVDQDADNAVGWVELGTALARNREYPEAGAALRRAIALNSEYALRYGRLVQIIEEKEDVPAALRTMDTALKGIMAMVSDQSDEAVTLLNEALALDPHYGVCHLCLGLLRFKQGDREGFVQELRRAMDAEPNVYRPWEPFIDALFVKEDFDLARTEYEKLRANGIYVVPDFAVYLEQKSTGSQAEVHLDNTSPSQ